jgi:hypothetical protein
MCRTHRRRKCAQPQVRLGDTAGMSWSPSRQGQRPPARSNRHQRGGIHHTERPAKSPRRTIGAFTGSPGQFRAPASPTRRRFPTKHPMFAPTVRHQLSDSRTKASTGRFSPRQCSAVRSVGGIENDEQRPATRPRPADGQPAQRARLPARRSHGGDGLHDDSGHRKPHGPGQLSVGRRVTGCARHSVPHGERCSPWRGRQPLTNRLVRRTGRPIRRPLSWSSGARRDSTSSSYRYAAVKRPALARAQSANVRGGRPVTSVTVGKTVVSSSFPSE